MRRIEVDEGTRARLGIERGFAAVNQRIDERIRRGESAARPRAPRSDESRTSRSRPLSRQPAATSPPRAATPAALAQLMIREQLAEAQRRAREWFEGRR